jgi:hypothetical protein
MLEIGGGVFVMFGIILGLFESIAFFGRRYRKPASEPVPDPVCFYEYRFHMDYEGRMSESRVCGNSLTSWREFMKVSIDDGMGDSKMVALFPTKRIAWIGVHKAVEMDEEIRHA